ncbi:MAG: tRNA (guanosine(37)-N1)-methyltransferase TrmD [Acidobacteria bacterium]|nr:tRNA (guanosine(37)-N1)-methyltransferase TrmD [Acidobacteriota bacterium]MBI3658391.1 tRNA (guanosine(37)-N1)-methyltransferase TrmD [Acidobacteriota bacterium]
MIFEVITIFPELFSSVFNFGIVKRALVRGLLQIRYHDLRAFADDPHKKVDDRPYGGGDGMVLKPEPIFRAVAAVKAGGPVEEAQQKVLLLSPQGTPLTQALAAELTSLARIILICGRYEGVDERVKEALVDLEISVGDYILTGGEIPAMVVIDSVARLLPGALGGEFSATDESFARGMLDFPQYTRPAEFRGLKVPEVLLSGDHRKIQIWREQQARERTIKNRPDLLGIPYPPRQS